MLALSLIVLVPVGAQNPTPTPICVDYNGSSICGQPADVAAVIQVLNAAAPAPTATPVPTAIPTATPTAVPTAVPTAIPTVVVETNVDGGLSSVSGEWAVNLHSAAFLDRGDGTRFYDDAINWVWQDPQPELWPTPPNVRNPLVPAFRVEIVDGEERTPYGVEIVNGESLACEDNDPCIMPVSGLHYRLFTGDYNIPGYGACSTADGHGCAVIFWNVGSVEARVEGIFHQGWTNHGRFFNGGELDVAIYALTSHIGNVMLHLDSDLNPTGSANAGGNCGVIDGCESVYTLIIVMSGGETLLSAETTMSR